MVARRFSHTVGVGGAAPASAGLLMLCTISPLAQAATSWTVNNTADPAGGTASNCNPANAGTCSLRDAIAAASSGDAIAFAIGSNKTIKLTSNTTLTLDKNLTIDGSGSPGLTLDGNNAVTVVAVNSGVTAAISALTIAHGQASVNVSGAGLLFGGGIYNHGTLTLTGSTISGNAAASIGGGIANKYGSLTLDHSTIQGNSSGVDGGGIWNQGTLVVANGTLSGNSSYGGGAISNYGGPITLTDSTISANTSAGGNTGFAAGGLYIKSGAVTMAGSTISGNSGGLGGGVFNGGTFSVSNSTFAGGFFNDADLTVTNATFADFQFASLTAVTANNTIFNGGCFFGTPGNVTGSISGSGNLDSGTTCAFAPARSNATFNLGPLQNNGGPTFTSVPGPGSAAIDAGIDSTCNAAPVGGVDQRDARRPQGAHCDVGAVEAGAVVPCYVKHDALGSNDGSSWFDAYIDLQSALLAPSCKEIRVARGVYWPTSTANRAISFSIPRGVAVYGGYAGGNRSPHDPAAYVTVLSGDIDRNDYGVDGIDADASQINGNNSYHVVMMDGRTLAGPITPTTVLDGFTITGGYATGAFPDDRGGALYCNGSGSAAGCSPTLSQLRFVGNASGTFGGAFAADGSNGGYSNPTIVGSTFSGNSSNNGGAAFHDTSGATAGTSSATYANDTFSGNSVSAYGGAIYNRITSGSGTVTLINTTFSGNNADAGGGAIADYSVGGSPTFNVTNSILWGDTSLPGTEELVLVSETPTFKNSVVKGSGGSGAWNAAFGTDGGGNLDADPKLGTLKDNGGNTPTRLPGASGSAIDSGLDSACAAAPVNASDQRGVARPSGTHCDIGAVESIPITLSITDGQSVVMYGHNIDYTVSIHNTSLTNTVNGLRVTGFGSAALQNTQIVWNCTIGVNCTHSSTAGPFDDTISLAPLASVTWQVDIFVGSNPQDATATYLVRAVGAGGASDVDTLAIFRSGFEAVPGT